MASGEAGVPVPKTLRIKLKLNGRVVKNAALHSAEQAVGEIEPHVAKLGVQNPLLPLPASWTTLAHTPQQAQQTLAQPANKRVREDTPSQQDNNKRPKPLPAISPSNHQQNPTMLKDKTPSGESSLDMLLEEGQLPPPKTTSHSQPGGSNSSAAAFQYLSNILNVPVVSNKPTRDFNTLVKEGQDKKRYSDAAFKRNRNKASPASYMFVLQSAMSFLEAALIASAPPQPTASPSVVVSLLQQTLVMLEAALSKEDTTMPPTQLLAFKLVARKFMAAIAMRIAQISRPSGKDAAKQVLNAARDTTIRDPFRDKPSPDSNVSSETSNAGRGMSLLHECATKCADLVLVQARVIEYAALGAQLHAAFVAEAGMREGAALAVHAQMLGPDLAAGNGEVLLHVACQTLGVLETFVNATERR